MNVDSLSHTKITLRCIIDLKVKAIPIKLLEEPQETIFYGEL